MERRTVPTALGDVWLWGDLAAFDGSDPVVLCLHGAFVDRIGRFLDLQNVLPVSVVSACLPGSGCPELVSATVGAFAAAYSEAAALFEGRLKLVIGESVGGVVALAMTTEAKRLALDPPLVPLSSSGLISDVRAKLGSDTRRAAMIWNVLGIGTDRQEARDYTHLLERPARILIGEDGYVSAAERTKMLAAPHIWLTVVPGVGHVIPGNAPELFTAVVRGLLS